MQHVDALSRCTNILVVETNSFEDNLVICQAKDPKVQKIKKQLEEHEHKLFEMRNGIVDRKSNDDRLLFYVPVQAHCPANLDQPRYLAAPLSRSPALSRSRSPALFPAPLRKVSAAPWSAERSFELSSSILAVILNKPRSYPRLFYK